MALPPDAVPVEDVEQSSSIVRPKGIPDDAVLVDDSEQQSESNITESIPFGKSQSNVGQVAGGVVEGVVSPIAEAYRSYLNATAGAIDTLDGMAKMVQEVSQRKIDTSSLQGILKEQSDMFKESASAVPETRINNILKGAYGLAGAAPVMAAEFLLPMKALKAAGIAGEIGMVASSAVLESAKRFNEDPEVKEAIEGAISGATSAAGFSAGLSIVPKIATEGAIILNNFGKKAWTAWLTKLTGKEAVSRDAVANPEKYLKVDPRAVEEIAADYKIKRSDARRASANAYDDVKIKVRERKDDIDTKRREVLDSERRKNDALIAEQKETTKQTVDELRIASTEAIKNKKELVDIELDSMYKCTLEKLNLVESTIGKEVGIIKDELVSASPGVSVDFKQYAQPIEDAILSMKGIKLENGKIVSTMKSPEMDGFVSRLNMVYDQLKQFRKDGEVPLEFAFLMSQKSSPVQALIEYSTQGKRSLFATHGDELLKLKEITSLKNVKPDGFRLLVKSEKAKGLIDELVSKNKEYSELRTKYDTALSLYAKKDPVTGEYAPNPKPAMDSLRSNNLSMIKRMEEADRALPFEDRLLPKVRSLKKSMESFEDETRDSLAQNLRATRASNRDYINKLSQAEEELKKSSGLVADSEKKILSMSLRKSRDGFIKAARRKDNEIMSEKDIVEGTKILNSWNAARMGGLQSGVGLASVIATGSGNIPGALTFGGAYGALSPKIAFATSRYAKKKGAELTTDAKALDESAKVLRKLLGLSK